MRDGLGMSLHLTYILLRIRGETPTTRLGHRPSVRRDFKHETNWEEGEERAYLDPTSLEVGRTPNRFEFVI